MSLQKHMDHVRPTTNLAKKPPQRLAQEKDRTHERDATPMETMFATRNKCHASSNKCLTSSNKKLLETISY